MNLLVSCRCLVGHLIYETVVLTTFNDHSLEELFLDCHEETVEETSPEYVCEVMFRE